MISLVGGMIFTVVIGYIVDKFEAQNNLSGGFVFLAVTIFVLNVFNFVSLALIKKDTPSQKTEKSEPISVILRETVGNKNFQNVVAQKTYLVLLPWQLHLKM
jgi:Na+/melibiose symporter-like transporter